LEKTRRIDLILLQWNHAPTFRGDKLEDFWTQRFSTERDILLIMGQGFDPRMNTMAHILRKARGKGKRCIKLIHFERKLGYKGSNCNRVEKNFKELNELASQWAEIEKKQIYSLDAFDNFVGDYKALQMANSLMPDVQNYSDIIADLGALPTYISYPLIAQLIRRLGIDTKLNIHISTGVEQKLDDRIQQAPATTRYLAGFESNLRLDGKESLPKIWVPILGPNRIPALDKLKDVIKPTEICPVLPFPSEEPRRPDMILKEYFELIFERWEVEPTDIFFASELGPLDVYRRLIRLHRHYQEALQPLCYGLGKTRTVVSPLCSKLLSIGVLLAAIEEGENGFGIAHAFGGGHSQLKPNEIMQNISVEDMVQYQQSVWVTGEPYQ
jgi:hypothetical protein